MADLTLNDGILRIDITCADPSMQLLGEHNILRSLYRFGLVASINKIEVTSNTPTNFDYLIVLNDGRRWKQTIDTSGPEVTYTFNVSDPWKLSEFIGQRSLRDGITHLLLNDSMTYFKCKW